MGLFDPSTEGFLWVIAIAFTVILLDVFFNTEILSAAALLVVSVYFAALFDVALKWQILIATICWLISSLLFFIIGKKLLIPVVNKVIPKGKDEAIHSAVGQNGTFRLIDGKAFVYWNSDLWPLSNDDISEFSDNQKVHIKSTNSGVFTVAKGES